MLGRIAGLWGTTVPPCLPLAMLMKTHGFLTDLPHVIALPAEQDVLPFKKAEEESKTGKFPMGFLTPQPRMNISLTGMGCMARPYCGRTEEGRALCIGQWRSGDQPPPPVTSTTGCMRMCFLSGLASSRTCLASRPIPGLALNGEMLLRSKATGTLGGQPSTARPGGPAGEEVGEEGWGKVSQGCLRRGCAPCLGPPTKPCRANSLVFSNEFPYLSFLIKCIQCKGLTTSEGMTPKMNQGGLWPMLCYLLPSFSLFSVFCSVDRFLGQLWKVATVV